MSRECGQCGSDISTMRKDAKYCSSLCRWRRLSKNAYVPVSLTPDAPGIVMVDKPRCRACGKPIAAAMVGRRGRYCSVECRVGIRAISKIAPPARSIVRCKKAQAPGRHTTKRKFNEISRGAAARGYTFAIDMAYIDWLFEVQGGKCAMSGITLERGPGQYEGSRCVEGERTMSLDRIDSTRGYIRGNVQWVHKDINIAKMAMSSEQFLSMCLNVVVHMTGWKPS